MDTAAFAAGAAVFGACIGSFLNVLIWRLPQEDASKRSIMGRSYCPQCAEQILWFDNVPVLSWLALRGKARCCGAKISFRYPFVELLTAAAFLSLALWPPAGPALDASGTLLPPAAAAFGWQCVFVSMLIALTFIDLDTQLLPDALTKPGMTIGVLAGLYPGLAGSFSDDAAVSPALRFALGQTASRSTVLVACSACCRARSSAASCRRTNSACCSAI